MLLNNQQNQHNNISSKNLKCDQCQVNVLKCCFCHESIKFEPVIWCLKCGHGIHPNCLSKIKPRRISSRAAEKEATDRMKNNAPKNPEEAQNRNDVMDSGTDGTTRARHPSGRDRPSLYPSASTTSKATVAEISHAVSLGPSSSATRDARPFLQCPSGCGCIGCFYS